MPIAYRVYCPKILAMRKKFKDEATESRCYNIQMEETEREDIPENLDKEFFKEALELRNKLLYFRFKYFNKEINPVSLRGMGLEPRTRQIFSSLLGLVENEEIRKNIIKSVKKKQKELITNRQGTLEYEILEAIKNLIKVEGKARIKEITERVNKALNPQYPYTSQLIGRRISDTLALEKIKDREGAFIVKSEKLKVRYRRYGIEVGQDKLE